jgi:hypothetical protein
VRRLLAAVAVVLAARAAAAQAPDPVAGYVVDLRGATSGLPTESTFFPAIPADTIIPARGFGLDVGGHVYVLSLGPSRVGLGATYLRTRGTSPAVATDVGVLAPQVSFNFGTVQGWSYLSAGLGRGWIRTTAENETGTATADADPFTAVNYGGGARWFLARRLGVGFDVRFHRLSGPPSTSFLAAAVGFSVR